VRVAIDDARFAHGRERPGEPFGADRDLAIATPALIAASIPLVDLKAVLDVAELRLGFGAGSRPRAAAASRLESHARDGRDRRRATARPGEWNPSAPRRVTLLLRSVDEPSPDPARVELSDR
jgi:hypothetical protein